MSLIDPQADPQVLEDGLTLKQDEPTAPALPDKLRGKSAEDIAEMYLNLEKDHGRLRNELGENRQLVDRVLRLEENRQTAPTKQDETFEIDPTDLLSDPVAALDKYFNKREQQIQSKYDSRINQLESTITQGRLKNQDFNQVINDPEFVEYVNASPIRGRLASVAVRDNDLAAVDDLISDWRSHTGTTTEPSPKPQAREKALEAARRASLESSSPDGSRTSGKIYSRAAVMKMRLEDPEGYYDASFQQDLLSAYSQGRVK